MIKIRSYTSEVSVGTDIISCTIMREKETTQLDNEQQRRRVEIEFPASPEGRLGALLASVNIGPKAVTLLLLPSPGVYIAPYPDLANKFREIFRGTPLEGFANTIAPEYCRQSLSRIGLVAAEYSIDYYGAEKVVGYGKTEAGEKYGVPAAALALAAEAKHNRSLYPILGATNVSSPELKRAPLTRAQILLFLSEQTEPVTEKKIIEVLGITQPTAQEALFSLSQSGVIAYEAVTPRTGKVQISYTRGQLPADDITPVNREPTLTRTIATICEDLIAQGKPVSQAAIYEELPEEIKKRRREDVLRININITLSGLARQGFLLHAKDFKGHGVQSSARITKDGQAVVEDFILPLVKLIQNEPGEQDRIDREIVKPVINNLRLYAQITAELYYPYSISFKQTRREENIRRVLDILVSSPKGLSTQDFIPLLGVNEETVRNYLAALREQSLVGRERVKCVDYYRVL